MLNPRHIKTFALHILINGHYVIEDDHLRQLWHSIIVAIDLIFTHHCLVSSEVILRNKTWDNFLLFISRLYDITKPLSPLDIISVGSVPSDQSLCSPGKTTFAEAFGEIVISFDFAGAMNADSFGKIRTNSDDVAYPMFLLRENGDVLFMLLMMSANR